MLGLILAVAGIALTIAFGAVPLRPKISVSLDLGRRDGDPLAVPFSVSNDWYFPISHVSVSCLYREVNYSRTGKVGGFTTIGEALHQAIGAGDSGASKCWPAVSTNDPRSGDRVISADVSIFIDYRAGYWPSRLTTEARFITEDDRAGGLRWIRRFVQ